MDILEFTGPYRFLSNFYIEPDGTHVEGEYQAHKLNPPTPGLLQNVTPSQAKAIGRGYHQKGLVRSNWKQVNLGIMQELVFKKFVDHEILRDRLVQTGDSKLIEGNWWGDTFWGQCRGLGENNLGIILMRVRGWAK